MLCLPNNKDLNRAKLAQVYVQIEVLEDASNGRFQIGIDLFVLQTGNSNAADARKINLAVAVHHDTRIEINLSPSPNEQLISGSDHIVCRNGNAIHGRKGAGNILEEI